ncbi:MAG: exo-alpha-sialidase [Actinobacteria bacterium]|nr:exo-alpha-sialidase [Actinomycetota bacterium]MCG2817524.1 exo-alpha-sialidase [Actinomycetes bacterium]MBU4219815.1 exo-alpha-sialidase [Actinomycetota bacterium]MBU4358899.1 exo-alpha-sialidase [Actinomycetota bacterium]MBU4392747.1 exo-alpha-sialidase [Actinomycetota bacterium]
MSYKENAMGCVLRKETTSKGMSVLCVVLAVAMFSAVVSGCGGVRERTGGKESIGRTWEKTFGPGEAHCVQQMPDNGYVVAGEAFPHQNDHSSWLMKLDAGGNQLWRRTFQLGKYGLLTWVDLTEDGGFVIAGSMEYEIYGGNLPWYSKIDSSGKIVWQKTFQVNDQGGEAQFIQQTADGGYVIAGVAPTKWEGRIWLSRTSSTGDPIWLKTIELNPGRAMAIQTEDGGYAIASRTPGAEAVLVRTDSEGEPLWRRSYAKNAVVESIQQADDNGFILGCSTATDEETVEALLIKTDHKGNAVWKRTLGGESPIFTRCVQQTNDNGYILSGSTRSSEDEWSEAVLLKTDEKGSLLWKRTFGGEGNTHADCVQQAEDGGYILVGSSSVFGPEIETWVVKTDKDGRFTSSVDE